MRGLVLVFAAIALVAGCEKQSARTPAKTSAGSSATKGSANKGSANKGSANKGSANKSESDDPCKSLPGRFKALLEEGGSCRKDTDCRCYPGGLVDCGGVTDNATAKRLETLVRLFRLARCKLNRRCAPRACLPRCVGGACVSHAQASR